MNFYLKINRDTNSAYKCMDKWINVISLIDDASIIVVCDKNEIVDKLQIRYPLNNITYIRSCKDNRIKNIVKQVTVNYLVGAAYAHLTCFAPPGGGGRVLEYRCG